MQQRVYPITPFTLRKDQQEPLLTKSTLVFPLKSFQNKVKLNIRFQNNVG